MKNALWTCALVMAVGAVGCGGQAWHVESHPPAWSEGAWASETAACGAPWQVKVEGGTAYVASETCVYALKTADQSKLWALTGLTPAKRYLGLGEGKVAVTSYGVGGDTKHRTDKSGSDINRRQDAHLTLLNAADGSQVWDMHFEGENTKLSPPAIAGGKVVVVSGDETRAFDIATQGLAWTDRMVKWRKLTQTMPFPRLQPVVVDGKVISAAFNTVKLYDLASGQPLGVMGTRGGNIAASPLAGQGTVYLANSRAGEDMGFGTGKSTLYSLRLDATPHGKKMKPSKIKSEWVAGGGNDNKDLGISNLVSDGENIYTLSNYRVAAYSAKKGKKLWEVKDTPVYPASTWRGTRTHHGGFAGQFTIDMSRGMVLNDQPGTNFAVGGGKVFAPAWYKADKKTAGRDVVTALDAKTGAYLGSFDVGGAAVFDLATTAEGALLIATEKGLMTARIDSFVPAPAAK